MVVNFKPFDDEVLKFLFLLVTASNFSNVRTVRDPFIIKKCRFDHWDVKLWVKLPLYPHFTFISIWDSYNYCGKTKRKIWRLLVLCDILLKLIFVGSKLPLHFLPLLKWHECRHCIHTKSFATSKSSSTYILLKSTAVCLKDMSLKTDSMTL